MKRVLFRVRALNQALFDFPSRFGPPESPQSIVVFILISVLMGLVLGSAMGGGVAGVLILASNN